MNIWIANHYAGGADRQTTGNYDIGRQLVRKGHSVTIITSSFSHYKFREERLAPGQKWLEQNDDGVRFIWVRTLAYSGNGVRRMLNMLSYAWMVLRVGTVASDRPDIVIASCPHLPGMLGGYLLSRRLGAKFFSEVRDLWPQTLIDVGALSERSPVCWALRRLERFLFSHSDRILTVLPNVKDYVTGIGIPAEKIVVIPNGVDLVRNDAVKPYDGAKTPPFIAMYLGGHARYNGVEVIVDAAAILQRRGASHVHFVIYGDGPEKAALLRRAQDYGLTNLQFNPLVPKSEVPRVMGDASVFLHHIMDIPVLKYGISSNKLFDYMSARRPIVFAVNGGNNPVSEAHAGITIPPENPEAMADAILEIAALTPAERIAMGENGRAYVEQHHDFRVLACKLEKTCLSVLQDGELLTKRPVTAS